MFSLVKSEKRTDHAYVGICMSTGEMVFFSIKMWAKNKYLALGPCSGSNVKLLTRTHFSIEEYSRTDG